MSEVEKRIEDWKKNYAKEKLAKTGLGGLIANLCGTGTPEFQAWVDSYMERSARVGIMIGSKMSQLDPDSAEAKELIASLRRHAESVKNTKFDQKDE